jgi:uncharacterized protein
MKHLIYLFLLFVQCKPKTQTPTAKDNFPRPVGYVNDFARILLPSQIILLDSILGAFERQTTNEIAIVTLDSISPYTIEDYSLKLAKSWGVGQKEYNNGVVMLFAMGERKMRISTGTGLEKILTNKDCGIILDSLLKPHFKQQDYYTGIKLATDGVITHLRAGTNFKPLR